MTAYYNEIAPYAAQWLRNLIEAGLIAPGTVDERSIVDVRPSDLQRSRIPGLRFGSTEVDVGGPVIPRAGTGGTKERCV